jgi:hypothetical protein
MSAAVLHFLELHAVDQLRRRQLLDPVLLSVVVVVVVPVLA